MKSIDLHAHLIERESLQRLSELGPELGARLEERDDGYHLHHAGGGSVGPIPQGMFDVARRLEEMDARHVDVQVLAVPPDAFHYEVDPKLGLAAARIHNDAIVSMCRRHPDRFQAFATLPLQDPAAAVGEMERMAEEECVRGVEIGTNVNGANFDAPDLEPVWDAAQALGMAVWLHPDQRAIAGPERLSCYYLRNFVGNPLETTIAIASLIFGGVLHRYPSLRFGFVHGGGFAPYQIGRWDHGWGCRPEAREAIPEPPSSYFGRMFFDSLTHDGLSLELLGRRVGWGHVVLGSDYPFDMAADDPVGAVQALGLDEETEAAVLAGNADRFLRPTGNATG